MRPAESPTLPDELRLVKTMLSAQELTDVLNFVRSIDDATQKFDSATDKFLQQQ